MHVVGERCDAPEHIARTLTKNTCCDHDIKLISKEYEALDLHRDIRIKISNHGGQLDDPSVFGIVGPGAGILYLAIRLLKPTLVVETGVSAGYSTAFILAALDSNRDGELISIDQPYYEGEKAPYPKFKSFLPIGLESGWLVPAYLRSRWTLHLGKSRVKLPLVLSEVGDISIFLHDSEHTEENMLWEFNIAWQHLCSGGVLIADDINMPHVTRKEVGDPFGQFVQSQRRTLFYRDRMGWLIK